MHGRVTAIPVKAVDQIMPDSSKNPRNLDIVTVRFGAVRLNPGGTQSMSEGGHRHISWFLLPGDSPLKTADVSVPVAVSNTRLPDSPSAHTSLLGMCGGAVLQLQTKNTPANLNSCI